MKLAKRVVDLKPSATLAVSTLAQELRAKGKDILSLSVGEPDFATPENICQAAIQAIQEGYTKYTPVAGSNEVRQAVAGYFKEHYNVAVKATNTILTNGGKHGLFNVLLSIIDPEDQVLIPAPYWVSYPPMVELAGGKPTIIPTTAEVGFKVTIKELEQNYTPKTKAIILNSPSNPTGAVYTKEEVDTIAAWAVEKNIIVIADEIYDRLVYAPFTPLSLAPWWEKHPENFIISGGLSKSFSMTGWRIGYVVGNTEIIGALNRLQGQSTSNICAISQKAAIEALTHKTDDFAMMHETFERRRNLAYEIVSSWDEAICPKPDGAFYIFPDVKSYYNDAYRNSNELCTKLLDTTGVALVPGVAFGADSCIRISYAVADDVLEKALTMVGKFLHK